MQSSENGNLDKLLCNLEFENQQFVKLIEKERQQISALEKNIEENQVKMTQLQESTSNLDQDTKAAHRQFLQNRYNYESLKNTSEILMQHETALEKKLELSFKEGQEQRVEHESIVKHYEGIWTNYQKEYQNWPLAQHLEKQDREVELAQESLSQLKDKLNKYKMQLKAQEQHFKGFKDEKEMAIKIAQMKTDSTKCKKEIEDQVQLIQDLKIEASKKEQMNFLALEEERHLDEKRKSKDNEKHRASSAAVESDSPHQQAVANTTASVVMPSLSETQIVTGCNTPHVVSSRPSSTSTLRVPILSMPRMPSRPQGSTNQFAPSLISQYQHSLLASTNDMQLKMPNLQIPTVSLESKARWPSPSLESLTPAVHRSSNPVITITPPQLPDLPVVTITAVSSSGQEENQRENILLYGHSQVEEPCMVEVHNEQWKDKAAVQASTDSTIIKQSPTVDIPKPSALVEKTMVETSQHLMVPAAVTLPSRTRMPCTGVDVSPMKTLPSPINEQESFVGQNDCGASAENGDKTTPGRPIPSSRSLTPGPFVIPPKSPVDLERSRQKLKEMGQQPFASEPLFTSRPMYHVENKNAKVNYTNGNYDDSQSSPFVSFFGSTLTSSPTSMFYATSQGKSPSTGEMLFPSSPHSTHSEAEQENSFGFNFMGSNTQPSGMLSMFGDESDETAPTDSFGFNFGETSPNVDNASSGFSLF